MAQKRKDTQSSARAPVVVEPKVTLAADFWQAGREAINQAKSVLEPRIDFAQIVDPEWLADPEHRKIALVLLKAAALQKDWALGIISGQIRLDTERMREQGRDVGSYDAMFRAFDATPGKTIEQIIDEEDKK